MKLVFATNNKHKLEEIKQIFSEISGISLVSLKDLNINVEIPEDYDTIEANALQKAVFIHKITNENVFADDTGLEIEALNGAPGVYSARFAGKNCSFDDNINKVLSLLQNIENRRARFRTVIAAVINGQEHLFEGNVYGEILKEKRGTNGFGYDPIFKPDGFTKTFAEMSIEEKNKISHRAIAFRKFADFLKKNNT